MENTVFERNYEIAEKDDRATAVFERAFAPGGFMEEFTKKMDAIPKVVVPKDKENYDYLLNRCDDYAKRHHGRIRGVVDYEHWDAHIDLYLRMLEFDDAEDMLVLDEDRDGFYRFIRSHLTAEGKALICTMGDGEFEMQSDISTAFTLQERNHDSGKMMVAGTSCRMVSWNTLENELARNGLTIIEKGVTSSLPDFNCLMYVVVKA